MIVVVFFLFGAALGVIVAEVWPTLFPFVDVTPVDLKPVDLKSVDARP